MNDPNYEARYKAAQKRVKELRELYVHVTIFVLANAVLFLVDYLDGGVLDWAYWVAIGWGVLLAIHALDVIFKRIWGLEWEERKMRQLMGETPSHAKRKRRLTHMLPEEDDDFDEYDDTIMTFEEESGHYPGVSGRRERQ
jgi:hypothetical protein